MQTVISFWVFAFLKHLHSYLGQLDPSADPGARDPQQGEGQQGRLSPIVNKVAVLTKAALKALSASCQSAKATTGCPQHWAENSCAYSQFSCGMTLCFQHQHALCWPSLLPAERDHHSGPAAHAHTQHDQQEWLKLPLKCPRDQLCTCAAFKHNQPAFLVCLLDSQLMFSCFFSTTSTASSSLSPPLSDSPVTTAPGVGAFRRESQTFRGTQHRSGLLAAAAHHPQPRC